MNQVNPLLNSYIQTTLKTGNVKALNLQPGQIIKGTVLDFVDNNNALVTINNTKLLARLEVALEKGQRSWFKVTSAGEEVRLKILTDKNSPNRAVTTNQDLMRNLDIKNTTNNRAIITELVSKELPIGKQVVENANFALDKGVKINNVMEAIKYLSDKNLPINKTNIVAVNEFFQNEDMYNKLENVNKSIKNIIPSENQNNEKSQSIITDKANNLLSGTKVSNSLPANVTENLSKINTQIEKLVDDLKNIRTEKSNTNPTISTNTNTTTNNNTDSNTSMQRVDSRQLMTNLTKFIDTIQNQFSDNIGTNNDSLAKNIDQLLQSKSQLPTDLANNLEKVANHLKGQNLALSTEQPMFTQLTVQVPSMVPFSDSPVFIQIHSKKKEEKVVNPEDMLLVFLFDLDSLGDLLVKMKVLNKDLFIQINNNHLFIKELVKELEDEFIEFIQSSGYQTSGITVQSMESRKAHNTTSYENNYKGVDIRL